MVAALSHANFTDFSTSSLKRSQILPPIFYPQKSTSFELQAITSVFRDDVTFMNVRTEKNHTGLAPDKAAVYGAGATRNSVA
jgi:hypothetical protein